MAGKTSKQSAKVVKKAAAKCVPAKAAKSHKAVARSSARKPTKAAAKKLPAQYAVPKATAAKSKGPAGAAKPTLLAGGNPQIAKADGDAPVQAYIAAMPGWKSDVGRRLDALIVHTVPDLRKAVKWNSPFYGVEGQGWFLNFHTFTKYVKVAFFRGTSLRPVPPASPSTRKCATSTSTRTTSSTRRGWRHGSGRRPPCLAGSRSAGGDPRKQSVTAPSRDLRPRVSAFATRPMPATSHQVTVRS
jgi:hypothetical protein